MSQFISILNDINSKIRKFVVQKHGYIKKIENSKALMDSDEHRLVCMGIERQIQDCDDNISNLECERGIVMIDIKYDFNIPG